MTAQVKICGIKTEAALDAALAAGADYVGLVFFPKSPRHLEIDAARGLARYARQRGQARVVTLLVDPDDRFLGDVLEQVKPDVIQLHGHETAARVRVIRRAADRTIWKAVPVATKQDVTAAESFYAPGEVADVVLFDAKAPLGADLPGGNGLAFDWQILGPLKNQMPFALAGGLTPENVAAAIALTGAAIVDVSSGVERSSGVKDPELIRRFLLAAKRSKQTL